MITQNYTPETTFRVRSFDNTLVRFFDTKENAQAFINHPANYGKDFTLTQWVL